MSENLPENSVEVAKIIGAFGIKGWLKILPFNLSSEVLFQTKNWFLKSNLTEKSENKIINLKIEQINYHSNFIIAKTENINDRNQAQNLKNFSIFIERKYFPKIKGKDEFYWIDLIGLKVFNRENIFLGQIKNLLPTGSHNVLIIENIENQKNKGNKEILIPFVNIYVDKVDLENKKLIVDWQLDY